MTLTLKNRFSVFITSLFTALFVGNVHADDYDGSKYYGDLINSTGSAEGTYSEVNTQLLKILNFARGAGIVVCIIMLTWCAIQLAMSSGNNQKRQLAMEGIKNVLIAVAIIGAATLICSLAYGILGKAS